MSSDRRIQATLDVKSGGELAKTANDIRGINEDLQNVAKNAKSAGSGLGKLQVAGEEQFSEISKQVALAGDVETNLRTIGGAIGTVGGEAGRAVEGVVALAAEFPAVVEAGPRLLASLQGFPAAMGVAAQSIAGMQVAIGGLTLGLGPIALAVGVATAAVAGFVAIFKGFIDGMNEGAEAAKNRISAEEEYFQTVVTGTESTAQARLGELETEREVLELRKQSLEAAHQEAESRLGFAGDIAGTFGSTEAEEYENALEDIDKQLEQNTATTEQFEQGLEDGAFKADEATQANEELAQSQSDTTDSINELVPAQEDQIQATEALTETAKDYSAELQAAAKKTADADKAVTASRNALFKSSTDISKKEKELAQEQLKTTEEYNLETIKLNQDAQDKLKSDREKALRDQSFLEVFDIESDFESQRQKREQERLKGLAELQQELADERAVKKEALAAESAEEFQALFDAIAEREEARKEERSLQEKAEREKLNIIDESHRHQIQSYQQLGDFTSQLFGQITQMASNSTSQIESILGSLDGKIGGALGGAGGSSITNNLNFGGGGMSKAQQRSIARMAGQ